MTSSRSNKIDSRSRRLELEQICTDFESAWRNGNRKSIEEVLSGLDSSFKSGVVGELVAVELELRSESGEFPEQEEYVKRFPNFLSQVEHGFFLWQTEQEDSQSSSLEVPGHIGDYKIIRKLGQGGMGVVYEAIQESLDRRVAIKSLGTHPVHAPQSARRFRREARAVAMLHHTNIINVYGSGVHNGIPYFAMQLVEGRSLRQILHDVKSNEKAGEKSVRGPISIKGVASLGVQIASALDYAHQQGILHRDIKPSNLLLDQFGTAWVSDFGLAKLRDSEATFSGDVVGTLRYLPPEATQGQWSELGDVYSLGITLYELLTLRPAFPETEHIKLLARITRGELPVGMRRIDSAIPRDLETIINKAINREPALRYQSAAELEKELQRFVDGEPILARPASSTERVVKWSKRNPGVAALMSLITLIVLIGIPALTLLWLQSSSALESVKAERTKTEIAKIDAEVARKVSEIARIDAQASKYGSEMQLAQKYLEDGNTAEVHQLFAKWLPENRQDSFRLGVNRRGWEWNYLNDKLDQATRTMQSEMEYVWQVAISPDDSLIATVHAVDPVFDSKQNSSEVAIWDASNGERLFTIPETNDRMFSIAFSPDGMHLATIGLDLDPNNGNRGSLTMWNVQSGQLVQTIDLPGQYRLDDLAIYRKPVLPQICFSPDGTKIMTAPNPVEIRDSATLSPIKSFAGKEAVFRDNDEIYVLDFEGVVSRYNFASGKATLRKPIGEKSVFDLGITQTDRLFVSCSNCVRVFSDSSLTSFNDHEFKDFSWGGVSADSGLVVAGDRGGRIVVCEDGQSSGNMLRLVGHRSTITRSAFSHHHNWMVTGSMDGTIKIWDLQRRTGDFSRRTELPHELIADIAFSDDGSRLYFAGRGRTRKKLNAGWVDLNPAVEDRNADYINSTYYANWPRNDFAFSPDGKYLVGPLAEDSEPSQPLVGYARSGKVGIWQTEDWNLMASCEVELDEITAVGWSRKSDLIFVAGKDDSDRVIALKWSGPSADSAALSTMKLDYWISIDLERSPRALAYCNQRLAIAFPGKIAVYRLDESLESSAIRIPRKQFNESETARYLDFSPDGRLLAVAVKDDNRFRVYDLEQNELKYERAAPRDVCCVRFSPDGTRLVLSGYDSLVYLCESATGHRLLSLPGSKEPVGSFSINSRVVFSPDGTKIATNNWRGEITVWEAKPNAESLEFDERSQ